MGDRQKHRGPHPKDAELFASPFLGELKAAVRDLSWLLTRGYAATSSLKLVGDRYGLRQRQRTAVARCSCGDEQRDARGRCSVSPLEVRGRVLLIDGFNVLTTVEAALSGGVLLNARDGCVRDLASMHGSYRVIEETRPAAELVMRVIGELSPCEVRWYLDRPVSNSGRLRAVLGEIAKRFPVKTEIELVQDPDQVLAAAGPEAVVATADSGILDRCGAWFGLAGFVIKSCLPKASILDLG